MTQRNGPVLFELEEDQQAPTPADAAPIDEPIAQLPQGRSMQGVMALAGRSPAPVLGWFLAAIGTLISIALSVWVWDFVTNLLMRNSVLGYLVLGLCGVIALCSLIMVLRELAGLSRLRRMDGLKHRVTAARASGDLSEARSAAQDVEKIYNNRDDLHWAKDRLHAAQSEILDAETLFDLTERELMKPLDQAAEGEILIAARHVATVTAIVPIAMADLVAALVANLRMIRRIAQIYGGRPSVIGNWRLTRAVIAHLVATGAVAVGDDLIGSVAGGGLLSKISRRFGEGVVNGALTARVGVAAVEVCRPMPFVARKRPSVTGLVKRALAGLFTSGKASV